VTSEDHWILDSDPGGTGQIQGQGLAACVCRAETGCMDTWEVVWASSFVGLAQAGYLPVAQAEVTDLAVRQELAPCDLPGSYHSVKAWHAAPPL